MTDQQTLQQYAQIREARGLTWHELADQVRDQKPALAAEFDALDHNPRAVRAERTGREQAVVPHGERG